MQVRQAQSSSEVMEKRYKAVNVVMFHWEEDDIGVAPEVHELSAVFKDVYRFASVDLHLIPSRNPYKFVERALDDLKRGNSDKDNLLIVYYSGHGGLDKGKLMWSPYGCVSTPPNNSGFELIGGLDRERTITLLYHRSSGGLCKLDLSGLHRMS